MPLLPGEIRLQPPPLGSQQHLADPWVYARFGAVDPAHACYVTEGSPEEHDLRFFGYLAKDEEKSVWSFFSLSELEQHQMRAEHILTSVAD